MNRVSFLLIFYVRLGLVEKISFPKSQLMLLKDYFIAAMSKLMDSLYQVSSKLDQCDQVVRVAVFARDQQDVGSIPGISKVFFKKLFGVSALNS